MSPASKAMTEPGVHIEGMMARNLFIVSRYHRDLYTYLKERFNGDDAVEIILDRRSRQRRQRQEPAAVERRRHDRRGRPEVDTELRTRSHAIITIP